MRFASVLLLAPFVLLTACGAPDAEPSPDSAAETAAADGPDWATPQDTTDRVFSITGLSGPEAVRYDPDQDVYFVSNFNGGGGERDGNGFISRVSADGQVEDLEFMTGGALAPLHAPRGMNISGDTLWAADVDGVHGFDRTTGEQVVFVDFTALEPGFLNDVAVVPPAAGAGPGGAVYVTDTGASVVYRIDGRVPVVAATLPEEGRPNGITWDAAGSRLLTVAWGGGTVLYAVDPATGDAAPWAEVTGGFFDGVELLRGRVLVASQADSSIHVVEGGRDYLYVRVAGSPADIAVDSRRGRVAVPYIALDRVDVWDLPPTP